MQNTLQVVVLTMGVMNRHDGSLKASAMAKRQYKRLAGFVGASAEPVVTVMDQIQPKWLEILR